MMFRVCYFIPVLILFSCRKDKEAEPVYIPDLMEIPAGFPAIEEPEGNEFTLSRWELGKRLFYDNSLSADNSLSCASCHRADLAFSDNRSVSLGIEDRPGTRNSVSLANVAYQPYLLREGGVPTLEMQVLIPIQEHNEFDFNIVLAAERLREDSTYVKMAEEAYNRELDAFVITRAIACFERSLLSGYSAYDRLVRYDEENAVSPAAQRGMELFFDEKTNCSQCHGGFNFTDFSFKNNGLYDTYEDEGRFSLTGEDSDRALFKVPGLRNIELTAPYMHDGSFASLEEVIEHYNSGGKNHPHKSEMIKSLGLSSDEKADLLEFLKALTDETFINNPLFTR